MTGSRRDRLADVALYLIATAPPRPSPDPGWLHQVAEAVRGGAGAVQLRQKGVETGVRRAWLIALRERLGEEVLLLVNDDLAAVTGTDGRPLADGLHLGREDAEALAGDSGSASADATRHSRRAAGLAHARAGLGADLLLGSSTRDADEIALAMEAGVDHVGFGAMATTTTKPGALSADPAELARCLRRFDALPIFPIGGIDERAVQGLIAAGCRRAAVGSAVLAARDPRRSAMALRALLEQPPQR
jgi:thiamine-phosphate pyrophosphorylase